MAIFLTRIVGAQIRACALIMSNAVDFGNSLHLRMTVAVLLCTIVSDMRVTSLVMKVATKF